MSAEEHKSDEVIGEQEDQDLTEKKNDDVEMEVANDRKDFESDEYGDDYDDYDYEIEMDDDFYDDFDYNTFWEYGSEQAESWRYPWRKSSQPPREKLLEIENMLNIWKPHKEKLLEEYLVAEKSLNSTKRILVDIDDTENDCLSGFQSIHLMYDNVLHEIEKAQAKVELESDKIISKIGNAEPEINAHLVSLRMASFMVQKQIQASTKTTFNQLERAEKLRKMTKEIEKGASDVVTSKNKQITLTERVIFELESDKAKMFQLVDELSEAREIQDDPVSEVNDI